MKNLKGFSVAGTIIGVLVAVLIGIVGFIVIDGTNKAVNFNDYDFYTVIEANKDNGNIGDHVKGNPDAPVKIYEYADFQCAHCASINPRVNKFVEQMNGKVAIVYRSFLLSYNQNSTAAASAAEAAGLQGYWEEYANALFTNQDEWAYAVGTQRTELFEKYFKEVTDGEGDMEKFREDVASEAVSRKISFDMGIGKRIGIEGTPAFYIDGQLIRWGEKDGGSVTINGETISWDSPRTGDEWTKLMKRIVELKLKK